MGPRRPSDLRSALRSDRLWRVSDVVVALLLAATSVVAVVTGTDAFGDQRIRGTALALISTLPVAVRQRWPIPVAACLLVANAADLAAAAPHEGALQPFVALVLAGYSVGSRVHGLLAVVGPTVLGLLAIPVFGLAVAEHRGVANEVTSYVWLVAAWAVGRTVRQLRAKTTELERANAALAEHRERAAEVAVTLERGRIAREVHDVVAHNVSMMVVQAGAAAHVLTANEPQVRTALETIAEIGRQTVDEMRGVLGLLRADEHGAERSPQPGLADLDALVEGLRRAGVSVTRCTEGSPHPVPRAVDLSAYRIVQEALTNSLKHAPGAHVHVVVRYGDDALVLTITDSGGSRSGCAPEGSSGGHGLVGMRERAALFGGEVTAAPGPDGFRVVATLPVPERTAP